MMKRWKMTYYYLATGMEGHADIRDYGIVEAKSSDEACEICAKQRNPGRPDLERWDIGCLSAKEIHQ